MLREMSLPPRLSSTEEKELLPRVGYDLLARDRVIEGNIRLVWLVINKFKNTNVEEDDLFAVGSIGLIKSVDSYNVSKNIKFSTYATRCIQNEILMHLRWNRKKDRETHIDTPIYTDSDGHVMTILDTLTSDDPIEEIHMDIEKKEHLDRLRISMEKLPDRERILIEKRYSKKPATQKELGEILGVSQAQVSKIERKALANLKQIFNKLNKEVS